MGRAGNQAASSVPQATKDQAKEQDQPPHSQFTSSLETLRLSLEAYDQTKQLTPDTTREALKRYRALFEIYKKQDSKLGMAASLFACGSAHYFLGELNEALEALSQASVYSKETGFDFLRPLLEATLGLVYAGLGENSKALETLRGALPAIRGLNNAPLLARALKGLGHIHLQIGQKQKALECLNEALALYPQTGDWLNQIEVLPLISALKSSLGEPAEAMRFAQAAVELAKEKKAEDWEAYSYFAVGAAHSAAGDLEQSASAYNRSLELLRGKQDETGEATALNNLGLIHVARGDFDRALDSFERALWLAKSVGETRLAAYATNNIATVFYRRGEPLKGFRYFEEALAEARRTNDKRLEAAVLASQADAYFLISSGDFARVQLKEAADTFAAIEEPGHELEARIGLADAYASAGRYQEALDALTPALESRRITNDPARQGYILREMGAIYNLMGERDKALSYSVESLSRFEAAGDSFGQADLFAVIGSIHLASGDYKKADDYYTRGLKLARQIGLRQSELLLLTALGFLREKQGDPAQAERFYDEGIALSELWRGAGRIEEFKTELGSITAGLVPPAALLKFKLGKYDEAFDLAEKSRARTFLDQLNSARINIGKGADPRLVEQEQSLRFAMRTLEEKLKAERRANPSSEAARLMSARLKQQEETYATLLIRLKASNPDYAELRSYAPTPLNEIRRLLDSRTTLISYFVTSDKLLAFVITSGSLQEVEVPVKESDLRAAITWFRDFASLRDAQPQGLKQLHAWLIEPIRQYIKTPDVAIVPHGVLHYVPFAALTDGQGYFGDEHAIYYLPSASVLPAIQRRMRPGGNRVLAVAQSRADGLPALRFADNEAASVARLYHAQPLLTGRATRAEFLKRARECDVLHIAAHAEMNAHSPLFSRILLSPGENDSGALELREVYGLDLTRANLVVLSACQTQLGAHSKGDEIVALNRAFIYAGAPSVIASLWTVDDEATSTLMKSFHGSLKRGMNKAAALQAAQAETRKKYPHPYYWAAFALTGDPGKRTQAGAHPPRR